eukprot:8452401-Alexandrium_andersonii.AAC.1
MRSPSSRRIHLDRARGSKSMRSRQSRRRSSRPRRRSVSRSRAKRPSSSPAVQGPAASSGKRAVWKSRR